MKKEQWVAAGLAVITAGALLGGGYWYYRDSLRLPLSSLTQEPLAKLPAGPCQKGAGARYFVPTPQELSSLVMTLLKDEKDHLLARVASCDLTVSSQISSEVFYVLPEKAMEDLVRQLQDVAWQTPEFSGTGTLLVSSAGANWNYGLELTETPGRGWAWTGFQTSDETLFAALGLKSYDSEQPVAEEITLPESQDQVPE